MQAVEGAQARIFGGWRRLGGTAVCYRTTGRTRDNSNGRPQLEADGRGWMAVPSGDGLGVHGTLVRLPELLGMLVT